MFRSFTTGLLLAVVICAALVLLFLRPSDVSPLPEVTVTEETRGPAPEFPESSGPAATGRSGGGSVAEPAIEVVPKTPPMLEGAVLGNGEGIPGAEVLLFSARRVEKLMEKAEGEVAASLGGGMPDISGMLDFVRAELSSFRASAVIARTDADGRFEVRDVPDGGYFLLTLAPQWLFRYGDVVSLASDRTETIQLPLERGAAISGRVVDPEGGGVGGVRVLAEFAPPSTTGIGPLVRRALGYVNGEFLKGPFETVSAEDGSFTVPSLPNGTYNMTAYTKTGVESTVQGVETGTTGVIILFGRPASVTGLLSTPNGFPIVDVPLRLERLDQTINIPFPGASDMVDMAQRILGVPPREAESDEAGSFRFDELGAGRYKVSIEHPGMNSYRSEFRVEWGEVLDLGDIRIDLGSTITGRAISGETGTGLPGVRVTAMQQSRAGWMMMGGAAQDMMSGRLSAISDDDGYFELGGLRPSANYMVTAGLTGHTTEVLREVPSDGEPVELVLSPGERISGIVIDARTGAGIPAATVLAAGAQTTTDEGGNFVLDGVVEDRRGLGGGMWGGPPRRFRRGGEEPDPGRMASVAVRASGRVQERVEVDLDGARDGIRIEMRSVTPLRGTVYSPGGVPQAGALVRITPNIPEDIPFAIDTSLFFLGVTVADENGEYAFDRYFAPEQGEFIVIADFPGTTRGRSVPFQLDEVVEEARYDVQLLVASTITGVVTDGTGPVAGASVRLQKGGGRMGPQERMMMQMIGLPRGGDVVQTDETGRFIFEALAAGEFRLNAEMVGYSDSPEEAVILSEGGTLDLTLVIDPGAVLSGRVMDDRGIAVEGATVRVIEEAGTDDEMIQAQLFLGGALRSARTDFDGSYEIPGLSSGGYTLVAEKRGFARSVERGVYVDAGTTQYFTLLPSAGLVGQVVDRATGDPVRDFDLSVTPRERDMSFGGAQEPVSSAEGVFEREDLSPGTYDVSIRAAGFSGVSMEVELRPGIVEEELIELERAAWIEGVVLDALTGDPVSGARVKIELPAVEGEDPASMESIMRDFTGSVADMSRGDGRFELDAVPPGVSNLMVSHDEYVVLSTPTPALVPGQMASMEIRLQRGASIRGELRGADGSPAGFTYIVLVGADEATDGVRKGVVTEDDGSFHFQGLADGTYRLSSGTRGGSPAETTVTVNGDVNNVLMQMGHDH